MNRKEIKVVVKKLNSHFGCNDQLNFENYVFLINDDNKIYICKRSIFDFGLPVKAYSEGVYFGALKHGNMRLSLEGCQMVGEHATSNIFELDDDQATKWMSGEDIPLDTGEELPAFQLVKYKNDFVGCGNHHEGYMQNFVPKARRVKFF